MNPDRRARALSSLRGSAVGDAFGACFDDAINHGALRSRTLLPGPWLWTDDTQMACSIFAVLNAHGRIDQEVLARSFAEHYDIYRRYGPGTSRILRLMRQKGYHWGELARQARGGRGSWGNGAAMRVAPLGAWFADDLDRVVEEATASAQVTHTHSDAVAGAVAVAVAAALSSAQPHVRGVELLDAVAARTPRGSVRSKINEARFIRDSSTAAAELASDTKPPPSTPSRSASGSWPATAAISQTRVGQPPRQEVTVTPPARSSAGSSVQASVSTSYHPTGSRAANRYPHGPPPPFRFSDSARECCVIR